MRFKTMITLAFVASLSLLAGGGVAQAQNPPSPPSAQTEQGQPGQRSMGGAAMGGGMMTPEMMQRIGPMLMRSQNVTVRSRDDGGPLQRFSRLMKALDDPRAQKMLGISQEQADSLRKIVTDTEIFTIQRGANIAVDSIELKELLRADKPDKAAVMSKGNEISKDTSELISHYLGAILDAKAILTPQQQQMIREYLENGAPALPAPLAMPGRP
jgi:Spy/CpxP family protein refolding chaperone